MCNTIIKELYDSAMFQLSLSSKELFHSNFLYWLALNYRSYFIDLLDKLGINGIPDQWEAKREYNNFDFCLIEKAKNNGNIKNPAIFLVIENKVKSIPNQKQLNEYHTKATEQNKNAKAPFQNFNCEFMLLTLIDSGSISNPWKVVSYEKLHNAMNADTFTEWHRSLVVDYKRCIKGLYDLSQTWAIDKLQSIYPINELNQCKELRLHDVFEKLRYSQMCNTLITKFTNNGNYKVISNHQLQLKSGKKPDETLTPPEALIQLANKSTDKYILIDWGYSNMTGLLDIKIPILTKNKSTEFIIGIQVQNMQYRHYVEFCNNQTKEQVINHPIIQKLDFFGSAYKPNTISTDTKYSVTKKTKTVVNGECFGKYGSNFFYQYIKLHKDLDINTLLQYIHDEICDILSKI